MKYRLVELLACPEHPDELLRVMGATISEMFPCSDDFQIPLCSIGCGYLGNWFIDIPASLPEHHRLDCRRCLGNEIESATLDCPICGRVLEIADGVLLSPDPEPSDDFELPPINQKIFNIIEKKISLKPGELVLGLAGIPDSVIEKWCSLGIESLLIENDLSRIIAKHARTCTSGAALTHLINGPVDPGILRDEMFDVLVMTIPITTLSGTPGSIEIIPPLLRKSGRAVVLFPRAASRLKSDEDRKWMYEASIPEGFAGYTRSLFHVGDYDVMILKPGRPASIKDRYPDIELPDK